MFLVTNCPVNFDTTVLRDIDLVCEKPGHARGILRVFNSHRAKPVDDTFYTSDETSVSIFEGVVVNSADLMKSHAMKDRASLLRLALKDESMRLVRDLSGQFRGLYIDLEQGTIRAFTNQTNALNIYYYHQDELFIAGTSIKQINLLLEANGIATHIDETGALMLLTYGYMLSNYTTIQEIRHLPAGQVVSFAKGKCATAIYHRFTNEPLMNDQDKAIGVIHEIFSESLRQSMQRDDQAGKKHFAFLSGGLDSRQVVMTSSQLGIRDLQCLNFSDPGYPDEITARKIARMLGYELEFYSLKDGRYLLDLEKNLRYNEGQVLIHGGAHLFAALSSMDMSAYGLLHSGQMGDPILGSYLHTPKHTEVEFRSRAYSDLLFDRILGSISHLKDEYPNNEMYLMYNRGYNGIMNGDHACAEMNYTVSPFLDPALIQFCLNLAPSIRFRNNTYKEWIKKYNKLGARLAWEQTGLNLYAPQKLIRFYRLIRGAKKRIYQKIYRTTDLIGMAPFDKWWLANPALRERFSSPYPMLETLRPRISDELYRDILTLYKSKRFSELLQGYSLITGINYLYQDTD